MRRHLILFLAGILLLLGRASRGATAGGTEDAAALLRTGLEQIAAGNYDPAVLTLTRAREAAPGEPAVYDALAEAYLRLGLEPMAVMQFEKSIAADSTRTAPRLRLAAVHEAARRYREAGRCYRDVLRREPANDQAALALAALYARAKQPDAAAWVLEGYAARHPEDSAAQERYLSALTDAGFSDKAAVVSEGLLQARPDWVPALAAAARARALLNQPEPAVGHFLRLEQARALTPDEELALGRCFAQLKNDTDAVARFDRVQAGLPADSPVLAELAASYMRAGRYAQAAALYERRAAQEPGSFAAQMNLGLCRQQTKEYDAARRALLAAVALKPDQVKARAALAATYILMDSTGAARRAYAGLIAQASAHEAESHDELFEAYRYLSVGSLVAKDWATALDSLDKAVRFRPQDVEMHLYRGQALFALNRKPEAKREFETVLKMQPGNRDARKGLDLLAQYN